MLLYVLTQILLAFGQVVIVISGLYRGESAASAASAAASAALKDQWYKTAQQMATEVGTVYNGTTCRNLRESWAACYNISTKGPYPNWATMTAGKECLCDPNYGQLQHDCVSALDLLPNSFMSLPNTTHADFSHYHMEHGSGDSVIDGTRSFVAAEVQSLRDEFCQGPVSSGLIDSYLDEGSRIGFGVNITKYLPVRPFPIDSVTGFVTSRW